MTREDKPHIRRDWSILCKRPMWFCRGQGALGIADTAKDAWLLWRYKLREWKNAKPPRAQGSNTNQG